MDKKIEKNIITTHHEYILGVLVPFFAHEINNFITSISGYSQMALSTKRDDLILKSIRKNEEVCMKIRDFTGDIFKISKKDFEKLDKGLPHESLKLCEKIYGYHLKKRNITLNISGKCDHPVDYNSSLLNLYLFTLILDSEERLINIGNGEINIEISQKEKTTISYFDNSMKKSTFIDFYPTKEEKFDSEPQIGWVVLHKIAELHNGKIEKTFQNGNKIVLIF